ncbi:hypothetical protein U9M48_008544 [Paspalum notatum var. saurae]|uniref:Uncharacterized protein n=1 Tax=Paspalum notatum var. saurae TaxID=547442 RepID=A0AAQ3WDK6_PASNO
MLRVAPPQGDSELGLGAQRRRDVVPMPPCVRCLRRGGVGLRGHRPPAGHNQVEDGSVWPLCQAGQLGV